MEMRYNEIDRVRVIYERYVRCLPDVKAWVRYAKFEMQVGHIDKARAVYERAVQELDGEPSIVSLPSCQARAARPARQGSTNALSRRGLLSRAGSKNRF